MSGWIKLHRKIQEHWIWQEKPFDKKSAWIDLILLANHKDNKFLLGNELVEVKRGSFITSEVKLSERWGWSRTKVRSFLKVLEEDKMLIKKSDNKKTTLTIVNYSDYQISETAEEHQKNNEETSKKHQKNTNKNDKNDKNDKNIYINIVEYLNSKTNKNFKHSTKATQRLIDARLNEGFTLDDFKKVIDNKTLSWKGKFDREGRPLEIYLRPQTLFGTKFESYLNEGGNVNGKHRENNRQDDDQYEGIGLSFEDLQELQDS